MAGGGNRLSSVLNGAFRGDFELSFLNTAQTCMYDLKAVRTNGEALISRNVSVCISGSVYYGCGRRLDGYSGSRRYYSSGCNYGGRY